VPVLDGTVRMKLPAGTQSGSVFRLRGKGIPRPTGGRGDIHVRTIIETPVSVGAEAQALLTRLASVLDDAAMPRRRALRDIVEARLAAAALREAAEDAAAQASAARGSGG